MPSIKATFPKIGTAVGLSSASTGPYDLLGTDVLVAIGGTFPDPAIPLSITQVGGSGGTITWTLMDTAINAGRMQIWLGTISGGAISGANTQVGNMDGSGDGYVAVYAMTSAQTTQGKHATANSSSGAANVTVINCAANSLLVAGIGDFTGNFTQTADANTTKDDEQQLGDTYESCHKTVLTPSSGNFALGNSAPTAHTWAIVALEVLDAGGGTVRLLSSLGVGT